ncbi:MAG: DegT/DnrJ/EryC1/StrS family aminotransferase [Bacteroidales bacterium]|jgi:dTDP-4-amino-4,6-dideoxygalactose transaminase|nr:DegT/DnrJ/EryC1/StrS family aminotransferase [Bacteroidales bacterium]
MIIPMVDLRAQYASLKEKIDSAVLEVLRDADFINGKAVYEFTNNLQKYLGIKHVIPCANGTDALILALLALDLKPEDEVIVPDFTFAAPAEAAALLGLTPIFADVLPDTFCIDPASIERNITNRTKAIIAVHLFGQYADMAAINSIAKKYNLMVIEDAAQALGAKTAQDEAGGITLEAAGVKNIYCTSFFPSKNLSCYGDGGACFTNDDMLAEKIKILAHHGSRIKYNHEVTGINSRLDTLQAAILNVKLPYLDKWNKRRVEIAEKYTKALAAAQRVKCPVAGVHSKHIFHQYTILLQDEKTRNGLKEYLAQNGIASTIYYPYPIHTQKAYATAADCPVTTDLCKRVLSLPIYPELTEEQIKYITDTLKSYLL